MSQVPAAALAGTPILVLKEGSTRSKGKEAQRNNFMAAKTIAEVIKSSLGPRGMDKMLVDSLGDITITNDGATILKEMEVEHPAAKLMVEVAKTTDQEVGDGTTSAVVLAGELLRKAEELLDMDVHPTIIAEGYRTAANKAIEILKEIAVKVDPKDRAMLKKIAITSLASKLVKENSEQLADLVVDAVLKVTSERDGKLVARIDDIKVEKKAGGSIAETQLIEGIAIDKEVVHSGMPKRVQNAKIALISSPLEIEKTEFDAKINIERPEQIKEFLDEEQRILKEMVDKIKATGANVVLCQKGIDDVAQYYLAKAGILAVRRVKESDMEKASKATGARIVSTLDELSPADLGEAELVEERKLGEDKWLFIEKCKNPHSVTLLIRGGTEKVVDEADRALHDSISVVKDVVMNPYIVAGGGAPEVELALRIRDFSEKVPGKEQLAVRKFADALEVIPSILAETSGMDPIDTLAELRRLHENGKKWAGVNAIQRKISDMWEENVIEPMVVKQQIIKSASEAASMIIRIDDIIAAGRPKEKPSAPKPPEEGGAGPSEFE
ncbi:TCP-1/cpn60 chaperonin family protein [archaeon]|jgi:thermosome|nr:TCP-1/cpn60 chaperonin family protein [archaeon]NHV06778.1 thermosome subunit [Nitrososphaerota archaeon]